MPQNQGGGLGHFIAFLMGVYLVWTLVMAVAWNVGLYGAGLVDHKIGFWTAFGLALCLSVLRAIFGGRGGMTVVNNTKGPE